MKISNKLKEFLIENKSLINNRQLATVYWKFSRTFGFDANDQLDLITLLTPYADLKKISHFNLVDVELKHLCGPLSDSKTINYGTFVPSGYNRANTCYEIELQLETAVGNSTTPKALGAYIFNTIADDPKHRFLSVRITCDTGLDWFKYPIQINLALNPLYYEII